MTWITTLVIILGIVAIWQLLKVTNFSKKLVAIKQKSDAGSLRGGIQYLTILGVLLLSAVMLWVAKGDTTQLDQIVSDYDFILGVVIILGIGVVIQIVRVFELSALLGGRNDDTVSDGENDLHGKLALVFLVAYFAFFLWCYLVTADGQLPVSASEHGNDLDFLLDLNFLVITIVFVITHILLFYFTFKYRGKKGRKATFYAHNNKLELLWTSVPAIFLAGIIIYGLTTWNDIMEPAPDDALTIELYSRQFDWTARYGGEDETLGSFNYQLISGTNAIGLHTSETQKAKMAEIEEKIATLEKNFEVILPESEIGSEIADDIAQQKRMLNRVKLLESNGAAGDDVVVKGEFHIPVNKHVNFVFRSQDVIHSAYMPHFRAQMNCVPGLTTTFNYMPIITTDSMRKITGDEDFTYLLYCNKICGSAHYNMKMEIIVDSPEDYATWLAEQKTFEGVDIATEPKDDNANDEKEAETTTASEEETVIASLNN